MGYGNMFDAMIEQKLLELHTAFIAKVVNVQSDGTICAVQPLDKIKAYGKAAKTQAIITNVPVLHHVRRYALEKSTGKLKVNPIANGDLVLCICTERDLSASLRGSSTTPPVGHHAIKDAVVVGLFGGWE